MNKLRKFLLVMVAGATIGLTASAPASAAYGSLQFQGVTFSAYINGNTLDLTIIGALTKATDNWANVNILHTIALGGLGKDTVIKDFSSSYGSWGTYQTGGFGANAGCSGKGEGYVCIEETSNAKITDLMTFKFVLDGPNLDLSYPNLKVQFFEVAGQNKATGDLLSMPIPEPEIYAMMAIGLGVLGWSARRKKSKG